jgi:hypothetical protein
MKQYGDHLEVERFDDKLVKYKRAFAKSDPASQRNPIRNVRTTLVEFIEKRLSKRKSRIESATEAIVAAG